MGQHRRLFGRWNQPSTDNPLKEELARKGVRMFTYEALRIATQDFATRIGRGGFSSVYLGILDDQTRVAIKVYKKPLPHHANLTVKGMEVMSGIHHRNVNRIIGCCVDQGAQIIVSEYIENGTLYDLIGDTDRRQTIFNWKARIDLCIGIARGISYLHQDIHPRVIHRDIKPANILLDTNLTPKICDFDLLGFVYNDGDLPLEEELVSGTYGYMDPEYYKSSKYTEKVDVYAFGVVMLEVISGRRAILSHSDIWLKNSKNLQICKWASKLVSEDRTLEVVDPLLADFSADYAVRFINVALLCTWRNPEERPSMSEVQHMLSWVSNPCSQQLINYHMLTQTQGTSEQGANTEGEEDITADSDIETEVQQPGEQDANNIVAQVSVNCSLETLQVQEIETCNAQEGTSEEARVKQEKPWMKKMRKKRIQVSSGSGDIAERLYRTTVFRRRDFPEAVYPPYHTRVFRRLGSRNLYSFDF